MSGVINRHVASLPADCGAMSRLVGKTAPFPGLPRASVNDRAEHNGLYVKIDDYVLRNESPAVVRACCEDLDFK